MLVPYDGYKKDNRHCPTATLHDSEWSDCISG